MNAWGDMPQSTATRLNSTHAYLGRLTRALHQETRPGVQDSLINSLHTRCSTSRLNFTVLSRACPCTLVVTDDMICPLPYPAFFYPFNILLRLPAFLVSSNSTWSHEECYHASMGDMGSLKTCNFFRVLCQPSNIVRCSHFGDVLVKVPDSERVACTPRAVSRYALLLIGRFDVLESELLIHQLM